VKKGWKGFEVFSLRALREKVLEVGSYFLRALRVFFFASFA
jgi:hypothetical protein